MTTRLLIVAVAALLVAVVALAWWVVILARRVQYERYDAWLNAQTAKTWQRQHAALIAKHEPLRADTEFRAWLVGAARRPPHDPLSLSPLDIARLQALANGDHAEGEGL